MPLPIPTKPQRQLHDCHCPDRLAFEDALKATYPYPEKVFLSIKRQVWTVGKSSLEDFLRKFRPLRYQLLGGVVTRGGTVFFQGTTLPCCDNPNLDDYLYHLRLFIDERTNFRVVGEEYY